MCVSACIIYKFCPPPPLNSNPGSATGSVCCCYVVNSEGRSNTLFMTLFNWYEFEILFFFFFSFFNNRTKGQ